MPRRAEVTAHFDKELSDSSVNSRSFQFPEMPRGAGKMTEMIGVWGCKEIWHGEL